MGWGILLVQKAYYSLYDLKCFGGFWGFIHIVGFVEGDCLFCTMVNYHQTTMWENMFNLFPTILSRSDPIQVFHIHSFLPGRSAWQMLFAEKPSTHWIRIRSILCVENKLQGCFFSGLLRIMMHPLGCPPFPVILANEGVLGSPWWLVLGRGTTQYILEELAKQWMPVVKWTWRLKICIFGRMPASKNGRERQNELFGVGAFNWMNKVKLNSHFFFCILTFTVLWV